MQFLERLSVHRHDASRWLVEEEGETRVAWVFDAAHDPEWLAMVFDDAQRWLGFAHPRISRVRSTHRLAHPERDEPTIAIVVDDDRGPSLEDAAARLADTPEDRERWTVAQLIAITDGLGAVRAQHADFVHRCLEPEQFFVDQTGRARLRAPIAHVVSRRSQTRTGAGVIKGSLQYLSPEQARGVPLTPASDVFALGLNLLVALGHPHPFLREAQMQTLMAILMEPHGTITTHTPALAAVIDRALAKAPIDRFRDPAAFGLALYEAIPDAGDYDAVVGDRLVEWIPSAPQATGPLGMFEGTRCPKQWDDLTPTEDPSRRMCGQCREVVVLARSIAEVVPLAGHCVALRPR